MRVALVGNETNNNYRLCKWMRELDIDAELFHFRATEENSPKRSRPVLIDPHLADGYPDWINMVEGRPGILRNKQPELDQIRKRFDVAITSGTLGVQVAHFLGLKDIFHFASGGEINTRPWQSILDKGTFRHKLAQWRYRQNLDLFRGIFTDYKPMISQLRKYDLVDKVVLWSCPEDVHGNRKRLNTDLRQKLMKKYGSKRRVILWLSRLNMEPGTVDYKAPEYLAEALRLEHSKGRLENVSIVIGKHGHHVAEFQKLIADCGLSDMTDWIEHQNYCDLLTYLSLDNAIIFDELAPEMDELSGIAREAISVGGLVVKALDLDHINKHYGPGCPVIHADSPESCQAAIQRLMNDTFFNSQRDAMDHWAQTYMHFPRNVMRLTNEILLRSKGNYKETKL